MFLKTSQIKYFQIVLIAVLLSAVSPVFSKKQGEQIKTLFSVIEDTQSAISSQGSVINSSPNSSVSLDFSEMIAESWDEKDQPNNTVARCINGDSITGVEYTNVTIETVGNSFFSEAVIYFSNSNDLNDGLNFAIGSGNENSGTAMFNSTGIIDISDSGFSDVVSLDDKKFFIQFYEKIDDEKGAIDARFTNGVLKVWGVNLTSSEDCPFISSTQGVQSTDLSVTYALSTPVKNLNNQSKAGAVGNTLVFDIVVTNNSPITATGVAIQNTLSANFDFVQFSCDDGTNIMSPATIASVNVNDIPGMGVLNCTLNGSINATGTIENSVTVSATNDPGGANNTASIVLAGANVIVPINNVFTLILMFAGLLLLARKYNKI